MYRRAVMSRQVAELTASSILDSLEQAESFPAPDAIPSGAFGHDLAVVAAAPEQSREVLDRLHSTAISSVELLLAHAEDHVRGLANDMRRNPMPIWSPLTLCRAAQESTIWICHLLDPPVSTETRLCRIAALWLDDSQPARAAAATFGAGHAAGVDDYHEFKLTELEAAGFTIELSARGRPQRVRLREASALLRLNMTEQVGQLTPPGAPSPYRLSSGAAHGRAWMLERSVTRTSDGQLAGEGSTAGAAALTVMLCMKMWVGAWGGYFGLDVTNQLAAMRSTMETFARQGIELG